MLNTALRDRLLRYRGAARRLMGRPARSPVGPRFVPGAPLAPDAADSLALAWGGAVAAPPEAIAAPDLPVWAPATSDLPGQQSPMAVAPPQVVEPGAAPHVAEDPSVAPPGPPAPAGGPRMSSRPPTTAELRDTLLALRALRATAPPVDAKAPPLAPVSEPHARSLHPRAALGRRVEHLPGFNPVAPVSTSAGPAPAEQPALPADGGEATAAMVAAAPETEAQAEPPPGDSVDDPLGEPQSLAAPPGASGLSSPASEPAATGVAPPALSAEDELLGEAVAQPVPPAATGEARQLDQEQITSQASAAHAPPLQTEEAPTLARFAEPAEPAPSTRANTAAPAADRGAPADGWSPQPALERTPLSSAAPLFAVRSITDTARSGGETPLEGEPPSDTPPSATGEQLRPGAVNDQTVARPSAAEWPLPAAPAPATPQGPSLPLPDHDDEAAGSSLTQPSPGPQPASSQAWPDGADEPLSAPAVGDEATERGSEPAAGQPVWRAPTIGKAPEPGAPRYPAQGPWTFPPPAGAIGLSAGPERLAAPLPSVPPRESTRQLLRPLIGVDPADVPLHTGAASAQTVDAHRAAAIATRAGVFMGAGHGEDTAAGLALLAHELYHVSRRPGRFVPPAVVAEPDIQEERSAERMERHVALLARAQSPDAPPSPAFVPASRAERQGGTPVAGQPSPSAGGAPAVRPAASAEPAPHPIWGRLPAPGQPLQAAPQPMPAAALPEAPPPVPRAPDPLAGDVQRADLQRSLAAQQAATAFADSASVPTAAPAALEADIDALAQQVYARLRRRLEAERRRGAV